MKQILFFLTLFVALGGILNAQTEFTGGGDMHSWNDPLNWNSQEVPQNGDDILIDGGYYVEYYGDPETYGSLELRNGANLYIGGSLYLYNDFTVDVSSVLSIGINSDGSVDQVSTEDGNYYFNGSIDIFFHGFVPQIGDEYEFIRGLQGSCGTSTTVVTTDNSSTGFVVTLGTQCLFEGITFTVTGINYTTAIQWDGEGGDGLWNNPQNWDPNGVPPPNSLLIFNLPGAGGYANTNGAGTTTAYNIKVGKNNTLAINGDLSMTSTIYNNPEGTIVWNAGEYSKSSGTQSLIINYGTINLDGPGLKKLDNDVEIWSFRGVINHNQGDLEINNGKIRLFNFTEYNLGDNASIVYSSGILHDFEIGGNVTVKKENIILASKSNGTAKENSSGTSTINLTNLVNNGKIICETGTIDISGDLTTGVNVFNFYNGSYRGSGTIGFPAGHVLEGDIYPGSSPGVLTILDDLTTGVDADFNIEINGPNAGTQYDQIIVNNEAILNGNIKVTLGYLPANNTSFEILKAGTLTSCNFPSQIFANFGGTPVLFNVVCQNNILYLNGPTTLSTEKTEFQDVAIYPNPAKDVLNVTSNSMSKGHWQLINQIGQVVKEADYSSKEFTISLNNMSSGIYLFKLEDVDLNASSTKKIMISN